MSFVVLGFIAVFALAFVLGRTRAWWVPGAVLVIGALVMFGSMEDTTGDAGGIGALGNGVLALGSIGLGFVGVLLIVFGAVRRGMTTKLDETTASAPAEPLATARVVRQRTRPSGTTS